MIELQTIPNDCVINFKFSTLESKEKIKEEIFSLGESFKIVKISSVFKRKLRESKLEIQEFVIRAETDLTALETNKKLNLRKQNVSFSFSTELLIFNHEVFLSPQMTLPHPNVILDPLTLHCCSEVWPDYEHPVNKNILRNIDLSTEAKGFEFIYQGKVFLD